jgi:hypothetical protein
VNSHDAGLPPDALSEAALPEAALSGAALTDAALADAALTDAVLSGDPAVRGAPEWRQLSFRTSGLTIELEITGTGEARRLMGQLIPRQSAVVDIRHERGVITVDADSLGRFSADPVPLGQVSLRCHLGHEQAPIVTGWITL